MTDCDQEWSAIWPPERFYWAILSDTAQARGPARGEAGIDPLKDILLEPFVPVPLDRLHAVYLPLEDGRVLACAATVEDLKDLAPATMALTPSQVPAFARVALGRSADEVRIDGINLLVGRFEPGPVRAACRIRVGLCLAACLLGSVLIAVGLVGLGRARLEESAAARAEMHRLASEAGNPEGAGFDAMIDRIESELSTLRAQHAQGVVPPVDAAQVLSDLLEGWPHETRAHVDAISVQGDLINLSVSFADVEECRRLAGSIRAPGGWTLLEPRWEAGRGASRLLVQMRRAERGRS